MVPAKRCCLKSRGTNEGKKSPLWVFTTDWNLADAARPRPQSVPQVVRMPLPSRPPDSPAGADMGGGRGRKTKLFTPPLLQRGSWLPPLPLTFLSHSVMVAASEKSGDAEELKTASITVFQRPAHFSVDSRVCDFLLFPERRQLHGCNSAHSQTQGDFTEGGALFGASAVSQQVKIPPAVQEMQVWSLSKDDSPGEGTGNPLQHSCLRNPKDRGAWWAAVHVPAESWTRLSDGVAVSGLGMALSLSRTPSPLPPGTCHHS